MTGCLVRPLSQFHFHSAAHHPRAYVASSDDADLVPYELLRAEIYDMAGLGFSQFHRQGLKMLSASLGLGAPQLSCTQHCVHSFDDTFVGVARRACSPSELPGRPLPDVHHERAAHFRSNLGDHLARAERAHEG
jgi:hypothetical protein